MHQVTVEEAKARFDELIEALLRGENVILIRDGEKLAEIAPVAKQNGQTLPVVKNRPPPGLWKDKIWISDDFDEPLDELKEYME
jgi:antitoxin (DNA-binding transcriptional repressor) of toxin-antitoxin stability system